MPTEKSFFVKNEASISLRDGSIGDYLGGGMKYSAKAGSFEGMLALRANKDSKGGFAEFKYTTPKIKDLSLESRTRAQFEDTGNSMTTRLAAKYSTNVGKINIYEIAGATAKFKGGFKSLTPSSLTGAGINITPKLNCYVEGEVSKNYSIQTKSWGKFSPAAYVGVKYTF